MPKKQRELKFAPGVTAPDSDALSPDVAEALQSPAKVRITCRIDEDIYDRLNVLSGGKGYQTILNKLLRKAVFGGSGAESIAMIGDLVREEVRAYIESERLVVREGVSYGRDPSPPRVRDAEVKRPRRAVAKKAKKRKAG